MNAPRTSASSGLNAQGSIRQFLKGSIETKKWQSTADNGGKIILDTEKNSRVRDRQKVTNIAKNLGWSDQHLELFTQLVVAYTRDPSIENYLRVRKTFPDVDIQVASFGGMEAVYKLEPEFRALGIAPGLVAGGMDGVEPSIDALSLRILECIADREKISDGPGHIEKRRAAISDSMVAYLIAIMLESYDWNDDETFRVPASLIVLVRYQLCGLEPDLSGKFDDANTSRMWRWILAASLNPASNLQRARWSGNTGFSKHSSALARRR